MTDLHRLHEIIRVFSIAGFGDLFKHMGLEAATEYTCKLMGWTHADDIAHLDHPQRIRRVFEVLGPTFVKLGQILATRPDLFGPEWITEFEKLQWQAPPLDFAELRPQVEEDLGAPLEELFAEVDVSRTVGWFTSIYPVKLEAESEQIGEALKEIKELLRAIPKRGIGYGVLRYLSRDEEVVGKLIGGERAEMRFNYLGQFDQVLKAEGLFRPARESSGPSQAAENRMTRALNLSGRVVGGRLRMEWVYSEKLHSQERIAELANHYMEVLEELITHCRNNCSQLLRR